MTCRTCRYLRVEPNKAGKRVASKAYTYECEVETPLPPLPDSVTLFPFFRWPPHKTRMSPDDGALCPIWASMEDQT